MAPDQLPDVIAPDLSILFCGINPGASSAAQGRNFADRSNRFWKAIYGAGLTPRLLTAAEDQSLIEFGIGLTTAAARPSRQASELSQHELRDGAPLLERKVLLYRPRSLVFLGKPAFAAIVRSGSVTWGRQSETFGGAETWVVPNPSGLNRRFSLSQLIEAYSELKLG